MSKEVEAFLEVMLELLPSTKEAYEEMVEEYGEVLETVIIEDLFMPEILELIGRNTDVSLLEQVFEYFEKVSNSKDEYLKNIWDLKQCSFR